VGWTQEWGGPIAEIRSGDVVWCPPGVKHWHGATLTTAMTHIALTGTVGGRNVDWLEKVSDEQYRKRLPPLCPRPYCEPAGSWSRSRSCSLSPKYRARRQAR
jgi:hypothetical protein